VSTSAATRSGLRDVFAVPAFRGLFGAQVLSLLGDQLARVALAVLVYGRSGSALLAAVVYGLGFLPALVGGPLLSGLADRRPRRALMVQCDLARAGLVALLAWRADDLVVVCVLLVASELLAAPFAAARAALVADVLTGERYVVGSAVGNVTDQLAQVLGFTLGGGLVVVLGARPALVLDAATFLASALLLRASVPSVPPADAVGPAVGPAGPAGPAATGAGVAVAAPPVRLGDVARLLVLDPWLRVLVSLALLCAFYVVPEGLAAPYAAELGGGAGTVGLLMAAQPVGAVAGAVLLARFVGPERRRRLMAPLAVLAPAALVGCGLVGALPAVLVLLVVSGVGTAYQLAANAAFVVAVPPAVRGRAFGLVRSGLATVQGLAFVLAGAAAGRLAPSTVVAAAGGTGALLALLALRRRDRGRPPASS
jgi:MFS family permease